MSESILELTVRNPGEADEAQMIDLLMRAFHRWPQFEIPVPAIEHFRWKMRSDPVASDSNPSAVSGSSNGWMSWMRIHPSTG